MKTHLLTKKRALISSVAMLLVAIIALGTATFAWFTKSTSANADGINVKTVKSSALKLSDAKTPTDWKDTLHYTAQDKILKPVSSTEISQSSNEWFYAEAADSTAFTRKDGDATACTDENINDYVYKEQLNVKNDGAAGDSSIGSIKIVGTFSGTEAKPLGSDYIRVALCETEAGGVGKVNKGPVQVFKTVTDGDRELEYKPLNSINNEGTITAKQIKNNKFTFELTGVTLQPQQSKYYNLYVWFEGQDTDCKDDNAGQEIPALKFSVSGTNANT